MKPKTYELLARCIEDGVSRGYKRAFKYIDAPTPDHVENAVYEAVMSEISEWFDFEVTE